MPPSFSSEVLCRHPKLFVRTSPSIHCSGTTTYTRPGRTFVFPLWSKRGNYSDCDCPGFRVSVGQWVRLYDGTFAVTNPMPPVKVIVLLVQSANRGVPTTETDQSLLSLFSRGGSARPSARTLETKTLPNDAAPLLLVGHEYC